MLAFVAAELPMGLTPSPDLTSAPHPITTPST